MNVPLADQLVRDEIPELRRACGWIVIERILTEYWEIERALEMKLVEELNEFHTARSRIEEVEEIVDLIAVIDAIHFHEVNIRRELLSESERIVKWWCRYFPEEINKLRAAKAAIKGEFRRLRFIVSETSYL